MNYYFFIILAGAFLVIARIVRRRLSSENLDGGRDFDIDSLTPGKQAIVFFITFLICLAISGLFGYMALSSLESLASSLPSFPYVFGGVSLVILVLAIMMLRLFISAVRN